VGAVIAGARHARHLAATVAACTMAPFTAAERGALDALLAEAPGPAGDVYTLERDRTGRHGAIMRYNLNAGRQAS
jgi:phosphoribosylcarboxyaminoimidazole (NCAIR) mutase